MAVGIALNNSTIMAGLNTGSYTVTIAGPYTCAFTSTLPYKASGMPGGSEVTTGGSGLSVVIALNAGAVLTVATPSPTQPVTGGSVVMTCVAGDVITVVTSSSDADDSSSPHGRCSTNLPIYPDGRMASET